MSYINNKTAIIFFVFTLSSCTLLTKDFSQNPLSINHDQMAQSTWVSSNWVNNYCNTVHGYFAPYFGLTSSKKWMRAKILSITYEPIHFNKVTLMCDGSAPINIEQKYLENWGKDFKTSCGGINCAISEYADIPISNKDANYILDCKSTLVIRLSGNSKSIQFEYLNLIQS